jgi:hypothetical protein
MGSSNKKMSQKRSKKADRTANKVARRKQGKRAVPQVVAKVATRKRRKRASRIVARNLQSAEGVGAGEVAAANRSSPATLAEERRRVTRLQGAARRVVPRRDSMDLKTRSGHSDRT